MNGLKNGLQKKFHGNQGDADFDSKQRTIYYGRRNARGDCSTRDAEDAKWGRGPMAGKTGNPFVDDYFFNPWAPGGSFNRDIKDDF